MQTILLMFCRPDVSCQADVRNQQILNGDWYNMTNPRDIITITDSLIYRTDISTMAPFHRYRYNIQGDSISLKYIGKNYILVPWSSFRFSLNKESQILEIKGLEGYFPRYEGNVFRRKIKGQG